MNGRRLEGLYGIADAGFRPDLTLDQKVGVFLEGGASVIQLRLKDRGARELLQAARRAKALAAGRALILVNDRPDVALAASADGVHVGDEDLPVAEVRRLVGPDLIIGATARTLESAREAVAQGADYVGFGPVFKTSTKQLPVSPRGLEQLALVCRQLRAPVVAIGGVTLERIGEVARAGAAAAAVIAEVLGQPDPVERARQLARAFAQGRAP